MNRAVRVCTPNRDIIATNAWRIQVFEHGLVLYFDTPQEPFVLEAKRVGMEQAREQGYA